MRLRYALAYTTCSIEILKTSWSISLAFFLSQQTAINFQLRHDILQFHKMIYSHKTLYFVLHFRDDTYNKCIIGVHTYIHIFKVKLVLQFANPFITSDMMHICLESNLVNFDIPNIPKTVLRSPKRAVSHHAMGNALSKNVPVCVFTL